MNALDELRESLRRRTLPMNSKRLQREIADAIDTFEAQHPGLVDKTEPCPKCHRPTVLNGRHKERLLGYWRNVCPTCEEDAR